MENAGRRLRDRFADSRVGVAAICGLTRWRCAKSDGPFIPVLKSEVHNKKRTAKAHRLDISVNAVSKTVTIGRTLAKMHGLSLT